MTRHSSQKDHSHPTTTVEDYLMTMYVFERDYGEIVAARLAEVLNVSAATVAVTLQRMERDKWIVGKRKAIHLTEDGRAAAASVIRRHMLTEWLLIKIFKVPMGQTHNEAHGIEHAISPQLEERMRDVLGDPKVCPHGNPLPGFEKVVSGWVALTDLPLNETVTLRRIHELVEDNAELLNFLIENDVLPGTKIKVIESLPFNQTLKILAKGKPVTLGFSAAKFIFAERKN